MLNSQILKFTKICFIILLPSIDLFAGEKYSLLDCFEAALLRSEVLATQEELIIQAEENYQRALGSFQPSIFSSYSYLHQNSPDLENGGNTASSKGQQTLKITAQQPLFRGFRDFAALEATKDFITSKECARDWAAMQLYNDVAQAFYTCLSVKKDLHVVGKELDLYKKRIRELEERIGIGRSRITELLTVKAAMAVLKAEKEQLLGRLETVKEVLAFLTGLNKDTELSDLSLLPSKIEPLSVYESGVQKRPDVLAAKKNTLAFKANTKAAKGAHLPSADLLCNYYAERPDLDEKGEWDIEFAVTLPVFSGKIISSNVKTAMSAERQSEIQLSLIERFALQNIRTLHHNLKADLAQVAALKEAFNLSEKNYEATLKDYELGLVTNLEVLQSLTAYQDTERSLETIRYQTIVDYLRLEIASAKRTLNVKKRGTL